MRAIVLLFLLGFSLSVKAQKLTGTWTGKLPQDDKDYDFELSVQLLRDGNQLRGTCKIIQPIVGDYVEQTFEGTINGTVLKFKELKVVDSKESQNWYWCVKDFVGELKIDELNNKMIISGSWQGTNYLYRQGQYYNGDCSPGSFYLEKELFSSIKISGVVYDFESKNPIKATVKIEEQDSSIETSNGAYQFMSRPGQKVTLSISSEGYRSKTETIGPYRSSGVRDFYLEQKKLEIVENKRTKLKNVLFTRGKAKLLSGSSDELDELVSYLVNNQGKSIVLEGHTDKLGDSKKNLELSEERTETIKKYLVNMGIREDRISTKGFGDTQPICPSPCRENRRVEFLIQ